MLSDYNYRYYWLCLHFVYNISLGNHLPRTTNTKDMTAPTLSATDARCALNMQNVCARDMNTLSPMNDDDSWWYLRGVNDSE